MEKLSDAEWQAVNTALRQQASTERNKLFLRVGFVARIFVYTCLFGLLYIFWPTSNIAERPLGSLTLAEISTWAFFIFGTILFIRSLFDPSDEEFARRGWSWLGVILLVSITCTAVYFGMRP